MVNIVGFALAGVSSLLIISIIVVIIYFVIKQQNDIKSDQSIQQPVQMPREPSQPYVSNQPVGIIAPGVTVSQTNVAPMVNQNPVAPIDPFIVYKKYVGKHYRIVTSNGKCIARNNNWPCWDDPNMRFVIEDAGNGKVRVINLLYWKALYVDNDNLTLQLADVWADPNMEFRIQEQSNGKVKLKHEITSTCLYPATLDDGSAILGGNCNDSNTEIILEEIKPLIYFTEEYSKYNNLDSPGNDIKQIKGADVQTLARECLKDFNCRGFNSSGWLKHKITVGRDANWEKNTSSDLYIKNWGRTDAEKCIDQGRFWWGQGNPPYCDYSKNNIGNLL